MMAEKDRREAAAQLIQQVTEALVSVSLLLVGARRFELRTSSLSGTRSNQLSYAPVPAAAGGGKQGGLWKPRILDALRPLSNRGPAQVSAQLAYLL